MRDKTIQRLLFLARQQHALTTRIRELQAESEVGHKHGRAPSEAWQAELAECMAHLGRVEDELRVASLPVRIPMRIREEEA